MASLPIGCPHPHPRLHLAQGQEPVQVVLFQDLIVALDCSAESRPKTDKINCYYVLRSDKNLTFFLSVNRSL